MSDYPAPRTYPIVLPANRPGWLPLAGFLAAAVVLIALAPSGYRGGFADDWQYLLAAECRAAHGWCLPLDHWSAREPLVAPMGWVLRLFGETRATVALVPLAYTMAALILFYVFAARHFGHLPAFIGGLVLLLTPTFTVAVLQPNVDIPELTFVLAALVATSQAWSSGRRRWALVAGAALALAIQTRETSILFVPLFALAMIMTGQARRMLPAFTLGCILPLASEMVVYALQTGDPFYRYRLALRHVAIPSSAMPGGAYVGSPLFNPDVIAAWSPASGIDLHWTVNGVVNLLCQTQTGLVFCAAALFAPLLVRRLAGERRQVRLLFCLITASALVSAGLIYGFAIDPKPRMFMAAITIAALTIGVYAAAARRHGSSLLPTAVIALAVANCILCLGTYLRFPPAEAAAREWLALPGASITLSQRTMQHLALVPEARRLHVDDPAAARRIEIVYGACTPQSFDHAPAWSNPSLVRARPIQFEPDPRSWLAASPGGVPPVPILSLCLFARNPA